MSHNTVQNCKRSFTCTDFYIWRRMAIMISLVTKSCICSRTIRALVPILENGINNAHDTLKSANFCCVLRAFPGVQHMNTWVPLPRHPVEEGHSLRHSMAAESMPAGGIWFMDWGIHLQWGRGGTLTVVYEVVSIHWHYIISAIFPLTEVPVWRRQWPGHLLTCAHCPLPSVLLLSASCTMRKLFSALCKLVSLASCYSTP